MDEKDQDDEDDDEEEFKFLKFNLSTYEFIVIYLIFLTVFNEDNKILVKFC